MQLSDKFALQRIHCNTSTAGSDGKCCFFSYLESNLLMELLETYVRLSEKKMQRNLRFQTQLLNNPF
jgi:hypothetical protein